MALAGRRRLELAESIFALVAEVAGAPDEHYAEELGDLWGDEYEAQALRSLRALLAGSDRVRQRHQASVSLRILPRVLGAARRAQAAAEQAATVSLGAVTDNPVYLSPHTKPPHEAVYAPSAETASGSRKRSPEKSSADGARIVQTPVGR